MSSLLNQDFGSESEDDNFDPAPVDESDHEVEANEEVSSKPVTNGTPQRRRSSAEESGGARSPVNEVNGEDDDHGEEEINAEAEGEDDEEDEDDDDEEIIVRFLASMYAGTFDLTPSTGTPPEESSPRPSKSISRRGGRGG